MAKSVLVARSQSSALGAAAAATFAGRGSGERLRSPPASPFGGEGGRRGPSPPHGPGTSAGRAGGRKTLSEQFSCFVAANDALCTGSPFASLRDAGPTSRPLLSLLFLRQKPRTFEFVAGRITVLFFFASSFEQLLTIPCQT